MPCSLPIVLGSSSLRRRAVMEELGWQVRKNGRGCWALVRALSACSSIEVYMKHALPQTLTFDTNPRAGTRLNFAD